MEMGIGDGESSGVYSDEVNPMTMEEIQELKREAEAQAEKRRKRREYYKEKKKKDRDLKHAAKMEAKARKKAEVGFICFSHLSFFTSIYLSISFFLSFFLSFFF